MMLLKRLNTESVKSVNNIITTDTSNLVKKADYYTKTSETENRINDPDHDKFITTPEFNKSHQKILLQDSNKQI